MPATLPPRPPDAEPPDDASCWTKAYLLAHCEGYQVLGPGGPIGYVEAVRLSSGGEAVDHLLVRCSGSAATLVVPGELIADVVPAGERIRLRAAPA